MAACVACGAPIEWRLVVGGDLEADRLPLDAHPSMRGENRYAEGDDGLVREVSPDADVLAYTDHRTTCAMAYGAGRR